MPLLALAYLAFYGLQNALAFDFHPIVLAATLLSYLFYFYEEKKFKLFWLIWLVFLGLQENFFLLSSALGVFLIFRYRDWRRGCFIAIFSLLAFGFLPVLSPIYWILLVEEYAQRFLGTLIATRWNTGFQYNVILAPIAALAAVEAIKKYLFYRQKLAGILIVAGLVMVQKWQTPALSDLKNWDFYRFGQTEATKKVLQLIPSTASVAAANNLGPWLTHREQIVFLTNCRDNPIAWRIDMKRCFHLRPDYLVADFDPQGSINNFYPDYDARFLFKYFTEVQQTGEYRPKAQVNQVYLLERAK